MTESASNMVVKSGIWYVVGNFSTKAVGFISTPIFTRFLTTSEVGEYSNIISWIEILIIICTCELFSSVMLARFDFRDKLDDYIASNLVFGTGMTAFFYVIFLFCEDFILQVTNFSLWQFQVAFVYMLVYPASQMFLARSRVFFEYKSYVFYSFGSVFLSTVISFGCMFFFHDRLMGRVIGQYFPLILINAGLYFFFLQKKNNIEFKYIRYGLIISLPLIWHTLANSILSISDRIMIRNIQGSEANALYSIAYYCGLIVSVLWSSMNNAWSPWAYEQMNQQNFLILKKASKPYILFFSYVVIIFLLLAPELLLMMGGTAYIEAVDVIPPIMVAIVFQFMYSLYVNIEFFYKKQIYIAVGTSIAAVVNVLLNYIFIPSFGYIAAAYTTLVGYIVLFSIHYCLVRHMDKSYLYDTKFNLCVLSFFLIVSFFVQIVYHNVFYRIGIILLMVTLFIIRSIIMREELRESIKKRSIVGILSCFIKID